MAGSQEKDDDIIYSPVGSKSAAVIDYVFSLSGQNHFQ